MRDAAERVREAYADVRAGGTHQARLERDIAWDVTQRRLADLEIGESPLVFGRLDLERGVRWYVGRLAVEDESHTPLVVDWRAPVAEPFYRATAVALHRAAYLLYTHRRRLANQGVLLIGPSPVFLRYIEQVLPSLGEQDVQLSTISGLKPRMRIVATERPEIAALKGDERMARFI